MPIRLTAAQFKMVSAQARSRQNRLKSTSLSNDTSRNTRRKSNQNRPLNNPLPSEDAECIWLVQHLDQLKDAGKIIRYTHIPNETYTKYWSQKRRNKLMGVNGGFPDYVIMTRTKMICIEMKRTKKSVTSDTQKAWISDLNAVGITATVCKGFEEAKMFLNSVLT